VIFLNIETKGLRMGLKERRMREREALKEDILLAAKDIAIQDGWQAVTVRKIAEKIEYAPPIIYEYFEDKDALLREIKREGLQKLLIKYQQVLNASDDATTVLTNLAVAYWEFACENQELYTIMYGLAGISIGIDGLEEEIEQIRSAVKNSLQRVLKESKSSIHDFNWEDAIDIMRSLLHGVIAFSMNGGWQADREKARFLAMKGVQDLVTFWMQQ
jgi:AcrR family transcriptional regulator